MSINLFTTDTEFVYHPLNLSAVRLSRKFCTAGLAGIHVQSEASVDQSVNHSGHRGLVLKHGQPLWERKIRGHNNILSLGSFENDLTQRLRPVPVKGEIIHFIKNTLAQWNFYRQSNCLGWRCFDLSLSLSFALAADLLGFSIVAPIQTLPAAVAVGHKLPIQKALTSGTTVINVIHRKVRKYGGVFHLHGSTIRQ